MELNEISNLGLEFRNREGARFEGREVAFSVGTGIEELSGRSTQLDEGSDEMLLKVRRLRQRVDAILKGRGDRESILEHLELPRRFLFYRFNWPFPPLGIEVCVRWEKPPMKRGS